MSDHDQLARTAPPMVGDYVLLARPAVPGNAPSIAEAWQRRREVPSLVVAFAGGPQQEVELVTRGDRAMDSWRAPRDDLRVVGRARWAMLDENLDRSVLAKALRGSTIALDFDGPIHSYRRGWTGYTPEDPVTPGALEFVQMLLAAGARVVVHTSRADSGPGIAAVYEYLARNGFPDLEVTYQKVPAAAYVDDRAVHFDANRDWPYDDHLLAEVVRMCRTRHHGEAWEGERFGEDQESSASVQHYIDTGDYLPADPQGATDGSH